jgi:YjbE family integral membrane protein
MSFDDSAFWVAVLKIIGIDIVLSGDNAVVIALAARSLPPKHQKLAVFWGTAAAIVLRLTLIFFALALLKLPFLKLVGAVLLLWIGMKLLADHGDGDHNISAGSSLMAAIRTIVIADAVMSVDNVVAVAAAAKDSFGLAMFGIALSIPIIIFTSQILIKVMERFPVIIVIGAALLGFVAGEMAWNDPVLKDYVGHLPGWWQYVAGLIGAMIVVGAGKVVNSRRESVKVAQTGT